MVAGREEEGRPAHGEGGRPAEEGRPAPVGMPGRDGVSVTVALRM